MPAATFDASGEHHGGRARPTLGPARGRPDPAGLPRRCRLRIAVIDGDQLDLAPLVAAYLALIAVVEVLRRGAPAVTLSTSSWMLLLDGVFLALAVALTGGTDSRLLPLVFFHVTAVTLVVSYRTGLKLALWYALLLFLGHAAADVDLLGNRTTGTYGDAVLTSIGLLLFAVGAAVCSSVNERALRRSRTEMPSLLELGLELERARTSDGVARVLAGHVRTRLRFVRAMALVRLADRWEGVCATGGGSAPVTSPADIGPLPEKVWRAEAPTLVRALDADPALDALLPHARNVVVVPIVADGEALGVLLAEWGRGRRAQIPAVTAVIGRCDRPEPPSPTRCPCTRRCGEGSEARRRGPAPSLHEDRDRKGFSSRRLLAEVAPVLTRRVERVGHQLTAEKRLLHLTVLPIPLEEAPVPRLAPRTVRAQGGDLRARRCAVPHDR
jgi:hypothetical protein